MINAIRDRLTDYDTSDRLHFEPLTRGCARSPLKSRRGDRPVRRADAACSRDLEKNGVPISARRRHDRHGRGPRALPAMLHRLKLRQRPTALRGPKPKHSTPPPRSISAGVRHRTSPAGAPWKSCTSSDLERYMREAVKVPNDSPVLLDRLLNDAIEVDVDALADDNPHGKMSSSEASWSTRVRGAFRRFSGARSLLFASQEPASALSRQTAAMARGPNVVG